MKFKFYALKLSAIMIFIFLLQFVFSDFTNLFLLNQDSFSELWRFVTAIFLHGGFPHLLYNLFALALFGSILEKYIGSKKFLFVFFVTGIFANLISINYYDASLGASGAIFGIIGALVLIRPMLVVWAFGLPMPMFLAGALWAVGDVIGIFVPSNIANVAHLSGMFFGLVFGLIYRERVSTKNEKRLIIDESSMRKWEEVNLE
uniref:Rhomboid family protein n=1 Tax=uncultured marine group II/III euryarchaeote KM3_149_F06 TaxID=1457885 RepID=A0A075GD08_9EURY|nr:Rhomboid family protein [uncultured marine group II/III euryarchaeote KM3_149_F06]